MAHLGQTRVPPRGQGSGCCAGLAGTFGSHLHLLRTMLGADLPCNRVESVLSPSLSPHSPRCQHGQMTLRTRPYSLDAPKKGQRQSEPQPKNSAATLKHVNISGKHAIKAQKNTRAQQRRNTHLELAPPLKAHILLLCPVRSQISRYN